MKNENKRVSEILARYNSQNSRDELAGYDDEIKAEADLCAECCSCCRTCCIMTG